MISRNFKEYSKFLSNIRDPASIEESYIKIEKINQLKNKKNAVILAHNYMPPEIFYGVSDITGDSFELAKKAKTIQSDVIIYAGVHFMAETSKILNPQKKVFIPDITASCSLADGITENEVLALKKEHPGTPVLSYINSSTQVKALSDVIVTSSNALKIVESMPESQVILIPDKYLAANVQKRTSKKIYTARASCIVHELFTEFDVKHAQKAGSDITLSHLECRPEVASLTEFSGSTSQFKAQIEEHHAKKVMLMTEYSMIENLAVQMPEIEFSRHSLFCPHMQKITLDKIIYTLENDEYEITIEESLRQKAEGALMRMLQIVG